MSTAASPGAGASSSSAGASIGIFQTDNGAIWHVRYLDDRTLVLDEEGEHYATLPGLVDDPRLLAALVRFGERRYAEGQAVGRALWAHDLRALLDVPSRSELEALRADVEPR